MNRSLLSILAILSLLSCFQLALAIDLSEYSFPNTSYHQLDLSHYGDFSGHLTDSSKTKYSAYLNGDYRREDRSPLTTYLINSNHLIYLQRNEYTNSIKHSFNYLTKNSFYGYRYLSEQSNWFGLLHGNITYAYGDQKDANALHPVYKSNSRFQSLSIGAGYGRVEDVTALRRALHIDNSTKVYRVQVNSERYDAYIKSLADIINREKEYSNRYGSAEYKTFWYAAIESKLFGSQDSHNPKVSTFIAQFLDRELSTPVLQRLHGWNICAAYGYDLYGETFVSDSGTYSNGWTRLYKRNENNPTFELIGSYSKPISLLMQMNDSLLFRRVSIRGSKQYSYLVRGSIGLDYELTYQILLRQKVSSTFIRSPYVSKMIIQNNVTGYHFNFLSESEANALYSPKQNGYADLESYSAALEFTMPSHLSLTEELILNKTSGKSPVSWEVRSQLSYKFW